MMIWRRSDRGVNCYLRNHRVPEYEERATPTAMVIAWCVLLLFSLAAINAVVDVICRVILGQ